MCIFPSDGTNRIRFTGKGYKSHSQPDASGPPKTYCKAIWKYYTADVPSVKRKREILWGERIFSAIHFLTKLFSGLILIFIRYPAEVFGSGYQMRGELP